MRLGALSLVAAIGLVAAAMSANAAPVVPKLDVQAEAGSVPVHFRGCGWGYHVNRWGYCVPNRRYHRPYYSYRYYPRPYWRNYHYGGGYYPYWRYHSWYGY